MKFRDFFAKPVLHRRDDPFRLPSGRVAIFCSRDCGTYLVVPFSDQDLYPADWLCPCCEDDDRAEHFLHSHEPLTDMNRHRSKP